MLEFGGACFNPFRTLNPPGRSRGCCDTTVPPTFCLASEFPHSDFPVAISGGRGDRDGNLLEFF
jgi:hypothetical protein